MTDTWIDAPLTESGAAGMREFIEAVLGDQRGNVVMALAGGRDSKNKPIVNRPRWFTYPAQKSDMVRFAEQHDQEDVYLSPIIYGEQRDGQGRPSRAKTNAVSCQAIYMDSDACPPSAFRLKPSIHVDTSPGHGHDYWLLAEPVPAPRAAEIAHRISIAHKADGTDPSGWSSSKFLRMPTVNLSYGEPFPVTWQSTGEVYLDLDIEGAYDDIAVQPEPVFHEPETPSRVAPRAPSEPQAMPALTEGEDLAALLNRIPADNRRLSDLYWHDPMTLGKSENKARSEQRWALITDLMREGFNDQEVLSLVWSSKAAVKWKEDARREKGLWWEVQKARIEIDGEMGTSVTPALREMATTPAPVLLTDEERKKVAADGHFIDRYLAWARTRVGVVNAPLHTMNAWTYLSTCYSDVAHVWRREGGMPLNIYSVSIAESSSGKSEAARLMRQAINAVYPFDSPEIAADQSKNGLLEVMLEKDGAVALAMADEADATFRQQKEANWAQGVQQAWTTMYDGFVPPVGRKGQDVKAQSAVIRARVVMHMVGTPDALYDVLDKALFRSGYMQRHVFTRGEYVAPTRKMTDFPNADEVQTIDSTLTPRYWADRVWRNRARLTDAHEDRALYLTREATARLNEARWLIKQHLEALPDRKVFVSMANRQLEIMLKAAGMTAVADGAAIITERHVRRALHAVEHWLANTIAVVDSIAASAFSRNADEIEAFISAREGRECEVSKVYTLMKQYRPKDVDEWLDSLVKQGRIEAVMVKSGAARKYRYKGGTA